MFLKQYITNFVTPKYNRFYSTSPIHTSNRVFILFNITSAL